MNHKPVVLVFFPLLVVFLAALLASLEVAGGRVSLRLGAGPFIPPPEPACTPWQQVSPGGFNLPTGNDSADSQPYAGEEGFEVLVFQDRLYIGMEADNTLGARLWRSRPPNREPAGQSNWEEVIADPNGKPWGILDIRQVDHIDSLAEFRGELFASAANTGTPSGVRIFKSATGDPGSWEDALATAGPGFGNPANENFKDMFVFENSLCGGTWNISGGAEVWCTTDGENWTLKNEPGFGDPLNTIAWSGAVFLDAAYIGIQRQAAAEGFSRQDSARIYRARSVSGVPEWELVFDGGRGSQAAILLGEANGRLYAATGGPAGIRVWRSDSGDPGSWQPAARSGMAGSRAYVSTNTDGAVLYRDRLHVAVSNPLTGFRVWRLDPDGLWRIVGQADSYVKEDVSAQLAVFGDSLYAWTTNFRSGQTVRQTACAAAQQDSDQDRQLALSTGIILTAVFAAARVSNARKRGSGIIQETTSV